MVTDMDEHINKLHKVEKIETELVFKMFRGEDVKFPEQSFSELWFSGLKKWGKKFAEREYDLSERAKLDKGAKQ